MEFVTPIITPIVESLMVPIKKHLGFLVSTKENVKKMDDKIKQLNDRAKEVEATRKKAKENIEVVPERVEPWLEDVKKLNVKSDSLKETIGCFNVSKRYKVGKQSYAILEEIKELENRESKIVFTHTQKPLAEVGSTSMSNKNDFKSRDLIFNNALQALKSDNESQKMIALCGMPGVGKTTMMEQLKKAVEDSKTFDSVVKVVIGETYDANSLQQAIAQYLTGKDLTESAKDARADRLREIVKERSEQGKKILVIMDDLWKKFNLTDVGLSTVRNGFKLLFTSRFDNECTTMGVNSIFKVDPLYETEASDLFFRTVGPSPSDGDDAEFKRIGEQIVKKCGGLPIAIVTIAGALRGYIKEAWDEALYNLQHDDLQDFDGIVHKVFEMSYNSLKKEDDKAIFLLNGLFPDDFNIPIEDLMMYAWGLKLFSEVHTLAQARRRAKVCVRNLISANLLTESDINGHVKMHDLVRAFVLSNFSKVKQASIVNHESMQVHKLKKDAHKPYERIFLNCGDMCELPRDFNYSNLSLLILMNGKRLKFSKDIYERMEKLKVMSYEKLGFPLSPVMFEHSTKLRTIRLRSCLLINNDISFFGSLHNLEILSLVDCSIRRLPSTIGMLKKLKLLDLRGCIDLRIDDDVIQNLVILEELYLRALDGHVRFTHANYEELQKISQSLKVLELEFIAWTPQKAMSFKNLERFEISIGCYLKIKHSKDYSFKNKLNLVATCDELKACNISDLFERTEELELEVNGMYYIEDISLNHTFYQLRVFHVSKCANLTCLFTPDVANGLKKLEQLTISKCPVLKALVSKTGGVGVITFQKLKVMSLEGLPKMLTLFEGVIKLPELVELRLCGLPNFTSIYHDNSDMSVMQPLLTKKVIMPKLEKLDISEMGNLKQIWPCEISTSENITTLFVPELTNLKDVGIYRCDLLSHVFTFSTLESLNQLKELRVKECNGIKVIIEKEENIITSSKDVVVFPHLETLELVDLPNLEGFFLGMNEFRWPLLHDVKINDCPKLMVFTSGHSITPKLNYIRTRLGKHSLECGLNFPGTFNQTTFPASSTDSTVSKGMPWSFHNLIEINIVNNVGRSIIPSNVLLQLEKLEKIELHICDGVEEVFEVVAASEGQSGFDESQTTTPLIQIKNLKQVNLISMLDLKYLWKSNRSMVLEFPNLTTLSIQLCLSLEHVFTCSMVGSLVQLQDLHVSNCWRIEVIVKEEEESKNKLVKLPRLKSLKLECLSELKGFCLGKDAFSFPALDTLTIKECPEMTVFTRGDLSTPNLKIIHTDIGMFGDLNSFIKTNQQEDSSSEDDALSSEDEET